MSLRTRVLGAFAYVLVLVLVALEVPLALNVRERVRADVEAEAAGQAQLVATAVSGQLARRERLDRVVRQAGRELGGRVIVVDRRGLVLADSAGGGLRSVSYARRPEIGAALAGRTAQGTRRSDTLDADLLYTAVPIVDDGVRTGAVRVTQSVAAVQARVRRSTVALALVGLVALALGLALAWVLAGSLARPLRGLAGAARRVARGELDARATIEGSSEQREVARAFNDMTDRLGRALAAQGEFVANASHQLRTPLTGLRLRIEAAALKSGDGAAARDLEAAEREVARLAGLLESLLTLARAGERPTIQAAASCADAARRACERWAAQAEASGHELAVAKGPDVEALASPEDIAIALDNLVENALAYSPGGRAVTLTWERESDAAVLAVLDEGPGVPAEEAAAVFERFRRGSSAAGAPGTGLGLAVVAALARRWGGEARLVARRHGGTRAELRLPAAPAPRRREREGQAVEA